LEIEEHLRSHLRLHCGFTARAKNREVSNFKRARNREMESRIKIIELISN
jgi:hypothetical protein